MSSILAINNVEIAYDKTPVVRGVSLDVQPGEIFGLIGLNGAGKTTLIKAILGLRMVNSGSILISGHPPSAKATRRDLAYLPERFEPPWFLSAMEFVRFLLSLYARDFNRDALIGMSERVGLDPRVLSRKVQTYSKGMRQKLGLIATIMSGCDLLILDEPMSGLDPMARAHVKDLLMECRGQGKTVFMTSHILVDMDEMCDRVAVIHDGGIVFIGKPSELKKITGMENLERAFLHSIEKRDAA